MDETPGCSQLLLASQEVKQVAYSPAGMHKLKAFEFTN